MSLWATSPLVQFSSVAQSCLTLCNPMNLRTPDLPVHHLVVEAKCIFCVCFFVFVFVSNYIASEIPNLSTGPACERVPYCVETSPPSWLLPQDGSLSQILFLCFHLLYSIIFPLKNLGCLSGCLVSSTSIQKLFCISCTHSNNLLMNLWRRKWSPHSISPPSWDCFSLFYFVVFLVHIGVRLDLLDFFFLFIEIGQYCCKLFFFFFTSQRVWCVILWFVLR